MKRSLALLAIILAICVALPAAYALQKIPAKSGPTTDAVPEGSTNFYYTNARARAAISSAFTGLTYNAATGVIGGQVSLTADVSGILPAANGGALDAVPVTVYAAGTAYALTATPAAVTFGTTSPALTLPAAGTYLIRYRAHVEYAGATFAASETATLKLHRTNNTAADLSNSPATAVAAVVTTATGTLAWVINEVVYTTANANDAIALYGSVAATPSAGALNVVEASIIAQQLY